MPEFVNIPVPVDRVQDVYELLARKKTSFNNPDWKGPNADDGVWSDAQLNRLCVESSPKTRSILGAIAGFGDHWLSTDQIGSEAKLDSTQVVALLGPLFKRVRGRYGMENPPFESRKYTEGGYRYSMPETYAHRVREILGALAQEEEPSK
jgi:hypothetical protein